MSSKADRRKAGRLKHALLLTLIVGTYLILFMAFDGVKHAITLPLCFLFFYVCFLHSKVRAERMSRESEARRLRHALIIDTINPLMYAFCAKTVRARRREELREALVGDDRSLLREIHQLTAQLTTELATYIFLGGSLDDEQMKGIAETTLREALRNHAGKMFVPPGTKVVFMESDRGPKPVIQFPVH